MEKLFVTWKALNFRKNNEIIFREGAYTQLQVTGNNSLAVVYTRHDNQQWVLIAIPLSTARRDNADELTELEVESAGIVLSENLPKQWRNIFTDKDVTTNDLLTLKEVFKDFPIALLHGSSL